MKTILFIMACLISQVSFGQLKATALCPPFQVDLLGGRVNKLHPQSTQGEIKKTLPCSTDIIEEAPTSSCTGVFYKDKGISFYTDRNYIEITENYKGTLTPALMGAIRGSLFKILGHPKIKDLSWEAFQTEYGTLVLYYNKAGKINKLQLSSESTETMKLCE